MVEGPREDSRDPTPLRDRPFGSRDLLGLGSQIPSQLRAPVYPSLEWAQQQFLILKNSCKLSAQRNRRIEMNPAPGPDPEARSSPPVATTSVVSLLQVRKFRRSSGQRGAPSIRKCQKCILLPEEKARGFRECSTAPSAPTPAPPGPAIKSALLAATPHRRPPQRQVPCSPHLGRYVSRRRPIPAARSPGPALGSAPR